MPKGTGSSRVPLRFLDYVFILRPAALVPLWIFYLRGSQLAATSSLDGRLRLLPSVPATLGLASMTALLAGGYLLNQIFDVETDRLNRKLFFLPRGLITLRAAWSELVVLWLLAALLSTQLGQEFRWLLLASLVLSLTYSAPPIRAKSRAPLDLVWNGLGFGLTSFAAGWASAAPLTGEVLLVGTSYALAVAGIIASTTVLDADGDRALGMRTTAVVLGTEGAGRAAMAAVVLAAVVGCLARDVVGIVGALASLPLLIRSHVTGARAHRIAAHQAAVAVFAVVVAVRSPLLLVLLVAVYVGSRAYYRSRFGLAYPGPGTL
jgi:4-hydroxybenzoate polyprenyltransferase